MKLKDLQNVVMAHTDMPTKPSKAVRKWDGRTPYYIHPIWCAATLATETTLDEITREEGVQALLYHDILEDTTTLPEELSERVKYLVREMTFEGGSEQEMEGIWEKPTEIKLLKLYDKVSNLLDGIWMDTEKRKTYMEYTKRLCKEVEQNYGELNITRIARAIVS